MILSNNGEELKLALKSHAQEPGALLSAVRSNSLFPCTAAEKSE